MEIQRSRYPQELTLFIIGDISRDVLTLSIQQKKMINQFFPYIKLDHCFTTKTDKIVLLFNNADDCSKVSTGWKSNFLGTSTKAVYNEASNKKLHGIIEDFPIDLSIHVIEIDLGIDYGFKGHQCSSRLLLVLELFFESEAAYDIAITSGTKNYKYAFQIGSDNRKK